LYVSPVFPPEGIFFPGVEGTFGFKICKQLFFSNLHFGTYFVLSIADNNEQVLLKILPYNMLTAITSYKRFFWFFQAYRFFYKK